MSGPVLHIPKARRHLIESKVVGQTFQIDVARPPGRIDGEQRYPVLYLTDGNWSFDFARAIAQALQVAGDVAPFILVSIGYPGDNPNAGDLLRCRDYTPPYRPEVEDLPTSSAFAHVASVPPGGKRWGGAAEFLEYLRQELVPFVDREYPTIPGDRAFAGHSLGGGLGAHALFSRSDLFGRYILASPSLVHGDDDYGLRHARAALSKGEPLQARLFMAVGELETLDPNPRIAKARFVSSFLELVSLLEHASAPGLALTWRVFAEETHTSVWPVAFSHGIRAVFGSASSPQPYGMVQS